MKKSGCLSAAAVCLAAARCFAFTFEAGGVGAGGLAFAYGSYLDSRTEILAELGAGSLTAAGTSQAQLFPAWSIGAYAETDVLPWLAARVETRLSTGGFAQLALTSTGLAFDQYGLSFAAVTIPLLARAYLPVGPGRITGSLGPFLGVVAGPVTIVDRRSTGSTTAVIAPDLQYALFVGLSGGIGYAVGLGSGIAAVEIRADWALTPVAVASLGGEMLPLAVDIAVSYGVRIGVGSP